MKRIYFLGFLLSLLATAVPAPSAQARTPLTYRMARSIRRVEPDWRYSGGWCTCPPRVRGQVWRDIGIWERDDKQGHRETVKVEIFKAASSEESADWMRRFGSVGPNGSCQTERFQFGDEAYLLKCSTTLKSIFDYERILNYRRGRYIVQVQGGSQEIVERFAKYAIRRLPAGQQIGATKPMRG